MSPVSTVNSASMMSAGASSCLSMFFIGILPLDEAEGREQHVDELDADERSNEPSDAVDEQVVAQEFAGAFGAVFHTADGERNQQDDDDGVEDGCGQDGAA